MGRGGGGGRGGGAAAGGVRASPASQEGARHQPDGASLDSSSLPSIPKTGLGRRGRGVHTTGKGGQRFGVPPACKRAGFPCAFGQPRLDARHPARKAAVLETRPCAKRPLHPIHAILGLPCMPLQNGVDPPCPRKGRNKDLAYKSMRIERHFSFFLQGTSNELLIGGGRSTEHAQVGVDTDQARYRFHLWICPHNSGTTRAGSEARPLQGPS